jgi:hypothetical protein
MGGLELSGHQIDGVGRDGDEEDLHKRVIVAVGKGSEQIEVAGDVDDEVETLGLEGDSCAALRNWLTFVTRRDNYEDELAKF